MKTPTDFRDQTYESIRSLVEGQRLAVYEAWIQHGPGTTRELAARSGIDLLNVRPRTTELVQLGLVRLDVASEGHEGTYEAVHREEWTRWHSGQVSGQQQLI